MTLERDFRDFLAASTRVQTHVGSSNAARIFPSVVPEGRSLPALVYQRVTTNRRYSHDGATGMATVRMQVDSYSRDQVAFDLSDAVRKTVDAFDGTMDGLRVRAVFGQDEQVTWDADSETYRVRQDYMVTHDEATT